MMVYRKSIKKKNGCRGHVFTRRGKKILRHGNRYTCLGKRDEGRMKFRLSVTMARLVFFFLRHRLQALERSEIGIVLGAFLGPLHEVDEFMLFLAQFLLPVVPGVVFFVTVLLQ